MQKTAYVQKYYIYDPAVKANGDLGGARVFEDDDGVHVLASPSWAQYYMDQGMMGLDPLSKLKEPGKKLLAQLTRGRSTNPDDRPKRLPKYSKLMQSGAPGYSLKAPRKVVKKKDAKAKPQVKPLQVKPPATPAA